MKVPSSITKMTQKNKAKNLIEGEKTITENKRDDTNSRGDESLGVESSYHFKGRGSEFHQNHTGTDEI